MSDFEFEIVDEMGDNIQSDIDNKNSQKNTEKNVCQTEVNETGDAELESLLDESSIKQCKDRIREINNIYGVKSANELSKLATSRSSIFSTLEENLDAFAGRMIKLIESEQSKTKDSR